MKREVSKKARGFTGKRMQKQEGRTARRPATPDYLERAGLYYLQRFASSTAHFKTIMRHKVKRRGLGDGVTPETAEGWIDDLTARFVRAGLLDDHAYAAARAQSLHRQGRPARFIERDLMVKGISRAMIDEVLSAVFADMADPDLLAAIAYAKRRRLGPFRRDASPLSAEAFRKMLATFARAGFSYGIAKRVLDAEDERSLETLLR